MTIEGKYAEEVTRYVDDVLLGKLPANNDCILGCGRFKRMVESGRYEVRTADADFVIGLIETTFCHRQGEDLQGRPMRGKPFLLEPWEKFCIYGMLIFFHPGTIERVVKEAFIFIPRKNSKTLFVAALAYALALLECASGSKVYVVGAVLKQAMETFESWTYNLDNSLYDDRREAVMDGWRVIDNNMGHSISNEDVDGEGGSVSLNALASNPDGQDSFNCNIVIADEVHAYRSPKQYNILKEATKAYTNKLVIGITTAGDDGTGFCANRLKYVRKVLNGTVEDEQYFIYVRCADPEPDGSYDFTNPLTHQKANPNYGVTIRPADILSDSMQALNDPQQRKDFFAKSLNVFTSSVKAWFDVEKFRASNAACEQALGIQADWTLEQKVKHILAKRPIWFGGADLSKMHDLTAGALYAQCGDIDIIFPHAWFPVVAAAEKADHDNIPLFGWSSDGWLDLVNKPTNDPATVVNWFTKCKAEGFKISQVGHDRKFAREYTIAMKKAKFKIVDQPQYFYKKSEGFRHIEYMVNNRRLYYFGSDALEYCVQNVSAIEKTDDMIEYFKIQPEHRIDIFDASVFACIRMLEALGKITDAKEWLGE